jgi:hypothetical protein
MPAGHDTRRLAALADALAGGRRRGSVAPPVPCRAAAAVPAGAASGPPPLDGSMFGLAGKVSVKQGGRLGCAMPVNCAGGSSRRCNVPACQVVIVTGASSGMGAAMAEAFLAHGCKVGRAPTANLPPCPKSAGKTRSWVHSL